MSSGHQRIGLPSKGCNLLITIPAFRTEAGMCPLRTPNRTSSEVKEPLLHCVTHYVSDTSRDNIQLALTKREDEDKPFPLHVTHSEMSGSVSMVSVQ